MFRVNNFDKLLDKATSNLRLDPDWPTIIQICDLIRQNDCAPKYAVGAVKKKLYSQNPHQAMFALLTLESVVKNCGSGIHDEVASKAFCESLRDLVKTTQHENLRNKILELIQAWAFAFRNNPKYRAVQDTVNILKAEGFKFPALKESDAMFSADTAPEWADGEVCHRCRTAFSLIVRRHHCRACGQVFCQQCSSKTSTLPKFGIEKEVRVCDACYDKVSRPPPSSAKLPEIVDTASDYGPTQPQKRPPGGKTAEELQEEEELQLALALSQSEAEEKEKQRGKFRGHLAPETSAHPTLSPTPSSVSASPEHNTATSAEMSRYLDRSYWEQRLSRETAPPTAPTSSISNDTPEPEYANIERRASTNKATTEDSEDKEIDEFVETLKSQVEIFVNRMKSNSSRGRSIANDTSVQTLFMNITAMHSRLLRYIQLQDDKRVYLESLQDKVNQVRDSRAALDTLRAEHAARLAAQAEAAERQRQMQMAAKLQAMRKKKHEYLQYQRQLALQRVQEQEREMQMRQEQQKHQYMMSANNFYSVPGVSMHQFQPGFPNQPMYANAQFHPQMMGQAPTDGNITMPGQPQMSQPNIPGLNNMSAISQSLPQLSNTYTMSQSGVAISQPPMSSQPSMNQPNMRPNVSQQMQIPQQMLMQQMHQMRMPTQPGMHQMMSQHNGQTLPKQTVSQTQPNPMMSSMSVSGQNMPLMTSNPMLNMQMRMPMMQGVPQNLPGYQMNMPNQNNQQNPQMPSLPGQLNSLPGQMMHTMSMPTQPQSLPMHNIPPSSQSMQMPGGQIQGQGQPQMGPSQSMPMQGAMPNQQMMMPGQGMPQSQPMPGQQIGQGQPPNQLPGQQVPQMQGSQMSQIQGQVPQQVSQAPAMPQGQSLPQNQQIPQGQQNMYMGQNMPQTQNQNPNMPNQQGPAHNPLVQNMVQSQGGPMPGQPMQGHPPDQGQQNVPGQPIKMPPQQNFSNGPPGQTGQTNQGQVNQTQQTQALTTVKSEHNNNTTAELISFD